jgi:ABC-type dipeptide/oligopeptide/nickel transport system ATPase component
MAGTQNKGQHITRDLAQVRMQIQDNLLLLRRTLDVGQQLAESIRHHPLEWVSSGFVFGWLLSRLPPRKKKIYIYSENQEQVQRHRGKMMSKIRAVAWSTSKPLNAAYIAKKVAERIKTHSGEDRS